MMKRISLAGLLIAGLIATALPKAARADADPFAQDKWAANDPDKDFDVEILTYDELMSLNESDRSLYLKGLRDMIANVTIQQENTPDAYPMFGAQDSKFGSALAWLAQITPEAQAEDREVPLDEQRLQGIETELKTMTSPNFPGSPCSTVFKGDPNKCKSYKSQLAAVQAELAAVRKPITTNSDAAQRVTQAKKNFDAATAKATKDCNTNGTFGCSISNWMGWNSDVSRAKAELEQAQLAQAKFAHDHAPPPPSTNADATRAVDTAQRNLEAIQKNAAQACAKAANQAECEFSAKSDSKLAAAQAELAKAKQVQAQVAHDTDPATPKTEAAAHRATQAAEKAANDAAAKSAELCKTATKGMSDAQASCDAAADADPKVKALREKAKQAKADEDRLGKKANDDLAADIHDRLGKSCLGKEKPLVCAAVDLKNPKGSDYEKNRSQYAAKLKQSTQCMTGLLPSATSGSCLDVKQLKVGGLSLECKKANQTICNPWVYGATKTAKGYEAVCGDVPSKGSAKKRGAGTIQSCGAKSNDETRAFISQPIQGLKEGWEGNVRNPISHFCGGPLRAKVNCEACNQMAKAAQVAIAASGKIRKCSADGGAADDPGAGADKKSQHGGGTAH